MIYKIEAKENSVKMKIFGLYLCNWPLTNCVQDCLTQDSETLKWKNVNCEENSAEIQVPFIWLKWLKLIYDIEHRLLQDSLAYICSVF